MLRARRSCLIHTVPQVAVGEWLSDTPQDELVLCAGRVFGIPKLAALAEKFEGEDWWLAARLFAVGFAILYRSEGSTAATPNCLKCLDALVHVETSDDKDDLELLLLQSLFASTNFEQLMARGMRVVEVLKTGAAQRDPISSTQR